MTAKAPTPMPKGMNRDNRPPAPSAPPKKGADMKRIVLIGMAFAAVALSGCGVNDSYSKLPNTISSISNDDVYRVEDNSNGVICYVYNGLKKGGISCLYKR